MKSNESAISGCRPILCVNSVVRSIDYYVNSLGFRLGWSWSDQDGRFLAPDDEAEPAFALVCREKVQLMLCRQAQGAPGMWLHLDVDDARQLDALYEDWMMNGARIVESPSNRPWRMYEMRVVDPDDHMLRVSAPARGIAEPHIE